MNYYNEFEPKAAAWLRELIKRGVVANGVVDERSILEVKAEDFKGYTQCHFFAGIGGWSYALRRAGWPDDQPVWTGSCPCQPLSSAGLRKGHADERHLWPAFHDLISECRPATVFGEQVASSLGREWFAGIRADLEGMGYACGGADLCSAGVGSPNIRQRLYWVANAKDDGRQRGHGVAGNISPQESERCRSFIGVADADGRKSRDGRIQRGGEHGQQPEDGGSSRMGDAVRERGPRGDERGLGTAGEQVGQPQDRAGSSDIAGDGRETPNAGRVEHAERSGLEGHGDRAEGSAPTAGAGGPGSDRLGDSPGSGLEGRRREESILPDEPGFWSVFDLLPCTDGKARRVEPGTFPLADGVPARMVRLRGYGNAINPEVAAVFIRACRLI